MLPEWEPSQEDWVCTLMGRFPRIYRPLGGSCPGLNHGRGTRSPWRTLLMSPDLKFKKQRSCWGHSEHGGGVEGGDMGGEGTQGSGEGTRGEGTGPQLLS